MFVCCLGRAADAVDYDKIGYKRTSLAQRSVSSSTTSNARVGEEEEEAWCVIQ